MGFFSDIAGAAVGGLFGAFGDSKAADQFGSAAQLQYIAPQFQPTSNLFGRTTNAGGFTLNKFGRRYLNDLTKNQALTRKDFQSFNRGAFADRFFDAIDRLESRREAQAFSDLESRLFNQAGVSTGTQRQIADFQADIEDARLDRVIKSELAGAQMSDLLFDRFLKSLNPINDFNRTLANERAFGVDRAVALTPRPFIDQGALAAGAFQAGNTSDFFRTLGGYAGDVVASGLSSIRSPLLSPFGQPGGFGVTYGSNNVG